MSLRAWLSSWQTANIWTRKATVPCRRAYRPREARTSVLGKTICRSNRFARSTVPANPRRRNQSAQPRRVPA
ncbi:hypothetical protein ACNKHR_09365 [Shigella flexneri]